LLLDHDDPSFLEEIMLFIGKEPIGKSIHDLLREVILLMFRKYKIAMTRDESAHISWYK